MTCLHTIWNTYNNSNKGVTKNFILLAYIKDERPTTHIEFRVKVLFSIIIQFLIHMEPIPENNHRVGRFYSMRVTQNNSHRQTQPTLVRDPQIASRTTSRFGSFQSTSYNNTTTSSSFDPMKFLIPITDACLILMAVIFIIALGIVAMIVSMAIYKVYFMKSEVGSLWTDTWLG